MKKTTKKTTVVETVEDNTTVNAETNASENASISQPSAPAEEVKEEAPKRLGRPIVPGSNRQKAIAEREAKLASGELKRGRKVKPDSKRQAHLAHLAEMKTQGRLTGKKGRPVNPESNHQKVLAEKQARIIANGGVPVKPGRPKVKKVETAETVDVS